ncbi:MAG TPA: PQQ-binding-like beta-propeller repeat protein, partial [Acidimicrobiales bacterium]|nr:PQQ-binding-like beta-propeller repeat protein [Acidimicrobiales bacterium]
LAACSGPSSPARDGTPPEVGGDCAPLAVTPGSGALAWSVTVAEPGGVSNDPVAAGDGFLVGAGRCIGFVEPSGRVRWTISGLLVDGARFGDTVIIATRGRPSLVGVRADTGKVVWSRNDRGTWWDVVAVGRAVMAVGTSFDGAVVVLDPSTGRGIADLPPGVGNGSFHLAIVDEGLLLTAGIGDRQGPVQPRGPVVLVDGSGRIVLQASSGLFAPNPVGVVGDVVVVQSSGTTSAGDGEPSSHLVGLDRATGAERWRSVVPGLQAGHAVEVAGVVAVRIVDKLMGLDARTGAVRWSVAAGPNDGWPLVAAGPDAVAVGGKDGTVTVVEVADGRRRWSTQTEGAVAVLGTPDGEVLLAANDPDFYRAFRISDGTPLWTERGPAAGAGASRGGKVARLSFAGDTGATMVGLTGVVALRRSP